MYVLNSSWLQVKPYVDVLRENADREREALGFLPGVAYEEAARQGKVVIATSHGNYAGHLFLGGTFPHAKIVQLYVRPEHRNQRLGKLLLAQVERNLEELGYLTISANVAAELPANRFWERAGFSVLKTRAGGVTRGRTINVRVKDLNTPHLFRQMSPAPDFELSFGKNYRVLTPAYVLDLNVFWDVARQRSRSQFARQAVAAALDNFVRLVVTSEFANELRRSMASSESPDPALAFALELHALNAPPLEEQEKLVTELQHLVFPNQTRTGTLSPQDLSDLKHLATAIYHGANGFITSEESMLRCKAAIAQKFGLPLFHIEEFAELLAAQRLPAAGFQVRLAGKTLRIWDLIATGSDAIDNFLNTTAAERTAWMRINPMGLATPHVKRLAITADDEIVCAASWDSRASLQSHTTIALLSDEEHPAVEAALDALFNQIITDVSSMRPVLVHLELSNGAALARKAALLHGFRDENPSVHTQLKKVCVGCAISTDSLEVISGELRRCAGLVLPKELPHFVGYHQLLTISDAKGTEHRMEIKALERLLSPTLFVMLGRPGAIIPIRRYYAEELFGTGKQIPLIPGSEAILFSERIYLSSARNLHTLPEGSILFFYESGKNGGRSSVFGAARALGSTIHDKHAVPATLLRRGVIQEDELLELTAGETVTVTRFDNVMLFANPVPLGALRGLGCVDGANLVTARRIESRDVAAIFKEAYRD